jgi:hypothetical protein
MIKDLIRQFETKGEVYLRLKVNPGRAKTQIREIVTDQDGVTIRADIAAQAEKGKANQELIRFLAKTFGTAKGLVKIISGAGERVKLIKIKKI